MSLIKKCDNTVTFQKAFHFAQQLYLQPVKTTEVKEDKDNFYALGINYRKADSMIRSKCSISLEETKEKLAFAKQAGINCFILSTCNRTEIYGFGNSSEQLEQLLFSRKKSDTSIANAIFIKSNEAAFQHLFELGTGLDSQILGDFEIIGQLKSNYFLAKESGTINPEMERLMNEVFHVSKKAKNQTKLSSNAASTSFVAVQWIKNHYQIKKDLNITLYGTGTIGKITCENLVKHFPDCNITVVNRTYSKAQTLSTKYNVTAIEENDLSSNLASADVLIVATDASKPTITDKEVVDATLKILDLSVPHNVQLLDAHNNIEVISLDELSKTADENLELRKKEIPKVKAIITEHLKLLSDWQSSRAHSDLIKAFKLKLNTIQEEEISFHSKKLSSENIENAQMISNKIIQKLTGNLASSLKNSSDPTDQKAQIIQELFNL
ncbi:MAG: glutamyl-tRNA reductase [Flavobacteriales bacterium]